MTKKSINGSASYNTSYLAAAPKFVETKSLSFSSASETTMSLSRGKYQRVKRVVVVHSSPSASDKFSVIRKNTASTSNERTPSHADSVGVLEGEQYLSAGALNISPDLFSDETLRLYLDFSSAGNVYVSVEYEFTE